MSAIVECLAALPVEYAPSGDRALLVAWFIDDQQVGTGPSAILCLEDGRSVTARIGEFTFDYRWNEARQAFIDVSAIPSDEGEGDDDTDQEPPDLGGTSFPGHLPESHGAGQGDQGDEPERPGTGGPRDVDAPEARPEVGEEG